MNWPLIEIIVQILGVLIVGMTVFYLAIQTRQNTRALQASIRQSMLSENCNFLYSHQNFPYTNPLVFDSRDLSDDELIRVHTSILIMLRITENQWLQFKNGVIDQETWETYRWPLMDYLNTTHGRQVWDFFSITMGHFNKGYIAEVTRYLETNKPPADLDQRKVFK